MEGESNDAMKPLEGLRSETEDAEECSESLPPGFRFHPTDEELVSYYLTNKILDSSFTGRAIAEADLNKCEPWDLPGKAKMGEKEWYFFSQRDRKYPTGLRTNRATEAGYWKTTGKDREVFNSQTSALVGMKKTLVFYKGRAPKGEKTNWVMHEYRLEGKFSYHRLPKNCKDEWVVCRIFQKNAGGKKSSSSSSLLNRNNFLDLPGSPSLPSLLESPYNTTTPVNENEPSVTLESDSTSSKPILVNTVPTKPNITHYLQNTFPEPSNNQFTDLDKLIKTSSYMENLNFLSPSSDHSSLNLNNLQGLFSLANLNMHKLQPLQSQLMYSPHMNSLLPNFPSLHFSQGSHLNNQIMAQSNLMLRSFESQPNIIVDPSQKQPMDGSQRISQNNQEPTHNTDTEINEDVASANCNEDGAHNIDFDSMWSFREHPF